VSYGALRRRFDLNDALLDAPSGDPVHPPSA
jgi:hypothetical protein